MFISSKFVALAAFVSAVCALPSSVPRLASIPPNAAKLAHDTDNDIMIAYDAQGRIIGEIAGADAVHGMAKRDAGTCANISGEEIQRLPGWGQLNDYAVANWGGGWNTIDANPADYADMGAQLCIAGDLTPITFDGEPSCQTQSQETGGSIVGADGTVALSATQGSTSTTTVTVTKESSLAVGASISAKVEVPAIAEFTATLTSTVTFTNSLSTANTFTTTDTQTQTVTIQNESGKTCKLTFDSHTCNANGRGSQRMVAHGWAWVYYEDRHEGHYKWAMNMDTIIQDEEQRATYIDFVTSTSSDTNTQYNAVCE